MAGCDVVDNYLTIVLNNAMNSSPSDSLSAAFAALADPTRRAILSRLALGETSVGDLVKPFSISGPAISRHLRVLENARLIERRTDAQRRICRLNPPGLRVAEDWLGQYRAFWDNRLDRLVEVLEQDVAMVGTPLVIDPVAPEAPARKRKPPFPTRARRAPSTRKRNSP